jgi:hypothetical protein
MSIHPNSSPRRDPGRDQDEATRHASYQARREEVFRQRREREKRQREEEAPTSQQRRSESMQSNREGDLFETGDKALNDWTSKAAASSYDDLLIQDHHSADDVVQTLFAALNRMRTERDTAISVIEILAAERADIKGYVAALARPCESPRSLFQKVGLDENCPNHLLKSARRSFQKDLHPDLYPVHRRGEAERRFKEAEAVFDELFRVRKL